MQSVRADAPWCPSNIEFIRRINGLDSVEDVKRIVFEASYLVLGLGDVYLGAPVATPLDPRHRLVTTKYNPARTWTPENAVGIGGAYLCVYGMEGPGGYQFVGRTCQMWNTYRVTRGVHAGQALAAAILRSDPLLSRQRRGAARVPRGFSARPARGSRSTEDVFDLSDYRRFLAQNCAEHRRAQGAAAGGVRGRAPALGGDRPDRLCRGSAGGPRRCGGRGIAARLLAVASPVSGSVWKIASAPGQRVKAGDTLVLVESMKMELPVTAPVDGIVTQLRCSGGPGRCWWRRPWWSCVRMKRALPEGAVAESWRLEMRSSCKYRFIDLRCSAAAAGNAGGGRGAAGVAAERTSFNVAWSIYVGWMPWDYADRSGILKKWADKYGIKIKLTQVNDYVESINQYTAGRFDACAMTNMDMLTIPAAGGVDSTALIVGDFSNGNDGVVLKGKGKTLADIKGQKVNLVELSVSHYLLVRALGHGRACASAT